MSSPCTGAIRDPDVVDDLARRAVCGFCFRDECGPAFIHLERYGRAWRKGLITSGELAAAVLRNCGGFVFTRRAVA